MKRLRASLIALAALCALPPAAAADGVDEQPVAQSPDAIRGYWTPERMRAAETVEPPAADGAGTVEPGARAAALAPDQETNPALDTAYPQRIHGRLFLTLGGQLNSCSATVVAAQSRDLIVTAGHCVANPGEFSPGGATEWAANVLFVPAYRDGAAPFGTFPATRIGAPAAWTQGGDIAFDVGAANLAAGAAGLIQDVLGARGIAFNRSAKSYSGDLFEVYGYPARPQPDYDGERLILCYATFQGFEAFSASPVVAPCNQQQGSSGGGFVRGGKVESLVSHAGCINVTGCTLVAGTYLGEEAFQLYKETGGISKGKRKKLKSCKKKPKGKKRDNCRAKVQRFSEDPR